MAECKRLCGRDESLSGKESTATGGRGCRKRPSGVLGTAAASTADVAGNSIPHGYWTGTEADCQPLALSLRIRKNRSTCGSSSLAARRNWVVSLRCCIPWKNTRRKTALSWRNFRQTFEYIANRKNRLVASAATAAGSCHRTCSLLVELSP